MWVGCSMPGGKTEWNAFWADVNKIGAQAPSVGATIKPRVRRSFNTAGDGLPATYAASTAGIDPSLGVISAYSWVPRKPGTSLTGSAAYKEGVNDIAAGNQDGAITAFGNSVPDGQLVDLIPVHEWNAKVNDGVITKAEYVAMAKHLGDLAVSLRAATNPDGSPKHPKWRNQIRVGVCSTGYGIRTGQISGIDDLLQAVDIHTEDPYGKGGTLSAAPVPQTNVMWSDFVAPFLPGGTKDTVATPSRLRAGAIWEASCRTDNTTYGPWPGTTNNRPLWVQALFDNCLSKGYDYVSCFNSTVGGSQATFELPEDRRQLAEWMAKNADMGPLPTSWPARADSSVTNQPPTPPTHLKVTVGTDKRPALTWTASTDDVAVTGYTLSRNGTALTPALSGSAVSFTEPAALPDGTYVYLLRAYDAQGAFSTYSPQITAVVGTGGPALTATSVGPVGILAWQFPPLTATPSSGWLMRSGTTLRKPDGTTFRFAGLNAYWLGLDDNGSGGGTTPRYPTHANIDAAVSACLSLGVTVVRSHTLGFSFGSAACLLTGYNQSTGQFAVNTAAWEPIDYAVQKFGAAGIRLQLPLCDQFGYYHGGKRDFVSWLSTNNGASIGGVTPTSTDRNVTVNNATEKAAEQQFYNNATVRALFQQWIALRLNHVNQYTGVAAKNDPTCAIWELGNELWDVPQVSYLGWTQDMAAYVKGLAPNCLVDFGGAADGVTPSAYGGHPGLTAAAVDLVGTHGYGGQPFVLSKFTDWAAAAATAGKACTVGEFAWSYSNRDDLLDAVAADTRFSGSMFWALIQTGETHGSGYGSDDAAFYYPTGDSTQAAFATKLQAHSTVMGGAAPPTATVQPNLLKRATTAAATATDPAVYTLGGATGTLAMDTTSSPQSVKATLSGAGFAYLYPSSVSADAASVTGGTVYTGVVSVNASVASSWSAKLSWYDSAGTYIASRGQDVGSAVALAANTWTQVYVTTAAPANAAFALVQPQANVSLAAGTVFRVSRLGVSVGTSTTWTPGPIPATALLDEAGDALLDQTSDFLLDET